jgi:hypothetical protein
MRQNPRAVCLLVTLLGLVLTLDRVHGAGAIHLSPGDDEVP